MQCMWGCKHSRNDKGKGVCAWWNANLQFLSHSQLLEGIMFSTNTVYYQGFLYLPSTTKFKLHKQANRSFTSAKNIDTNRSHVNLTCFNSNNPSTAEPFPFFVFALGAQFLSENKLFFFVLQQPTTYKQHILKTTSLNTSLKVTTLCIY